MRKSIKQLLYGFSLVLILLTGTGMTGFGDGADFNAYDMINAVNIVRASRGLPPVQANPILMAIAQDHSDYQAETHQSSHAGRTGGIVTERVAASGYSQGRPFVAGENVAALDLRVTGMLPIIINEIWADPVHRGAMVNPKYHDAGVGIAADDEMVYITLNLAGITGKAATPTGEAPFSTSANAATGLPSVLPLVTVTAGPDGSVYHTVGYGQTLGTIARIYGVEVNDLVRLNQINPDKIYAGQRIFVRKVNPAAATATMTATSTQSREISATKTNTAVSTPIQVTVTPLPIQVNTRQTGIMIIFFLLILVLIVLMFTRIQINRPE